MKLRNENYFEYIQKLLLFLVIIDICMMPYIRPIKCLTSMLFLIIWYMFAIKKLKNDKEFFLFILTLGFCVISIVLCYLYSPKTAIFSASNINPLNYTITYTMIFVYSYLYYFYYKNNINKHCKVVKNCLKIILFFFFLFALIYLISPTLFYWIRNFWSLNPKNIVVTLEKTTHYRFTGPFSDPNNLACFTVAILIILLEDNTSKLRASGYVVMSFVILFATMSTMGFLAVFTYFLLKIGTFFIESKSIHLEKKHFLVLLGILLVFFAFIIILSNNAIVIKAVNRVLSNQESVNIRLNIWKKLLHNKNIFDYIFVGFGNAVLIGNEAISTHSGHLYLIYSYGMIVYLIYIYIFFRKRKRVSWSKYTFMIPLFLCFSVNVGLLDSRYSFLMPLLIVYVEEECKERLKIEKIIDMPLNDN